MTNAAIDQTRVRILPDGRMARAEAATYLGRKPKTLAIWHTQGKGPRSHLVGGRRFYYLHDLQNFIEGGDQDWVVAKGEEVGIDQEGGTGDQSRVDAKDNEAAQAEAKRREDDEDEEADADTLEAA